MASHVISARIEARNLVQLFDILDSAGIQTANMKLGTVVRVAIEAVCKRGLATGNTLNYSDIEAQHKLAGRGIKDIELEYERPYISMEASPPTTEPPTVSTPIHDTNKIETQMLPYMQRALEHLNAARLGGTFVAQALMKEVPRDETDPELQLHCPWDGVALASYTQLEALLPVLPTLAKAYAEKDIIYILALRIVLPNIPNGVVGTVTMDRIIDNMEKTISLYIKQQPDCINIISGFYNEVEATASNLRKG